VQYEVKPGGNRG